MQVLANSILKSSEQCLKMIEIDIEPDEHWSYLTKELLTLRDNRGRFVCNLPVPGVKWLPFISRIIEDRLKELRCADTSEFERIREGWLQKRGKLNRSYRKRYVVLGELPDHKGFEMLYFGSSKAANDYFNGDENVEPYGIIALNTITHVSKEEQKLVSSSTSVTMVGSGTSRPRQKRSLSRGANRFMQPYRAATKRQLASEKTSTRLPQAKKMDLQAFRRAVGAVFGLLVAQDIIDGVFRELSEQNMQLFSSVSSMASVAVSLEEGGAPVVGVSDDEETGRSTDAPLSNTADDSMSSKTLLSPRHATRTDAQAGEPEHTDGSQKQESSSQKITIDLVGLQTLALRHHHM